MVTVNEVVVLSLPRRAPHLGNQDEDAEPKLQNQNYVRMSPSLVFLELRRIFLGFSLVFISLAPSGWSCFMLLNLPPTSLMLREVSAGAGGFCLETRWPGLDFKHVIWTVCFSDSVFLSSLSPPRLSSHLIHLSVMAREENKLIDASKHFSLLDVLPALFPPPPPKFNKHLEINDYHLLRLFPFITTSLQVNGKQATPANSESLPEFMQQITEGRVRLSLRRTEGKEASC